MGPVEVAGGVGSEIDVDGAEIEPNVLLPQDNNDSRNFLLGFGVRGDLRKLSVQPPVGIILAVPTESCYDEPVPLFVSEAKVAVESSA